jgi:hypothetical protein
MMIGWTNKRDEKEMREGDKGTDGIQEWKRDVILPVILNGLYVSSHMRAEYPKCNHENVRSKASWFLEFVQACQKLTFLFKK